MTNLSQGAGSISVTYSASSNGTLLVSVPYSDLANRTIAEVLSSRVYVNGVQYANFSITLTSSYLVTLSVTVLAGDPTLVWAYSVAVSPPGHRSPTPASFLGLTWPGGLYVLVGLSGAVVVALVVVATRRRRGRPPVGAPADPPGTPVSESADGGQDLLHDVLAPWDNRRGREPRARLPQWLPASVTEPCGLSSDGSLR